MPFHSTRVWLELVPREKSEVALPARAGLDELEAGDRAQQVDRLVRLAVGDLGRR